MTPQTWTRQGSAAKPYVITLREDGRLSCTCPGWTFQRNEKPRSCKHTREIATEFAAIDARKDGEYVVALDAQHTRCAKPATVRVTSRDMVRIDVPPMRQALAPAYRPLMLADKMPDDRDFADFAAPEWAMEQKFDGERCLVEVLDGQVFAWSRAGRDREGDRRDGLKRDLAPQIIAALATLPDCVIDGEVIVKGLGLSSDVRRLDKAHANVLVLFDMLASQGADLTGLTYDQRRGALASAIRDLPKNAAVFMSTSGDPDFAMVEAIWQAGGEGVVLKRRASTYVGRRSADWIKVKQHDELVAEIIGFEDSKVNGAKNAVILYAFEHPKHGRVESKCKVLNNEWVRRIAAGTIRAGMRLEISYQLLMPSGKPRHGMAKRIVGEA